MYIGMHVRDESAESSTDIWRVLHERSEKTERVQPTFLSDQQTEVTAPCSLDTAA
jgi:hypothetical protein